MVRGKMYNFLGPLYMTSSVQMYLYRQIAEPSVNIDT